MDTIKSLHADRFKQIISQIICYRKYTSKLCKILKWTNTLSKLGKFTKIPTGLAELELKMVGVCFIGGGEWRVLFLFVGKD